MRGNGHCENLRGLQSVWGSPIYPSGHVHFGSCRITLQFAVGAQGFSSAQGLIHFRFLHALYKGHSSFWRHPTDRTGSVGSPTMRNKNMRNRAKHAKDKFISLENKMLVHLSFDITKIRYIHYIFISNEYSYKLWY